MASPFFVVLRPKSPAVQIKSVTHLAQTVTQTSVSENQFLREGKPFSEPKFHWLGSAFPALKCWATLTKSAQAD